MVGLNNYRLSGNCVVMQLSDVHNISQVYILFSARVNKSYTFIVALNVVERWYIFSPQFLTSFMS